MSVKARKPCKPHPYLKDAYICAGKTVPREVYKKITKKSRNPKPPKPKPDKPKKPSKPSTPDDSKGGVFKTPIHPFLPSRGKGKPTLDRLTEDQVLRARGIQGSKIFHKQGREALERHLKKYLPDYKLEKAIDEGIIVSKGGKGRVMVRGTNPKNFKDLMTDLKIMLGGIRDTQHYKNVKKLAQEAVEKFDKVDISGYSLGGGMSYSVGQELDIPSLSFNPLVSRNVISEVGPQNIARNLARETGYYGSPLDRMGRRIRTKHQLLRTTTDPISLLMGYSDLPANARVDTIDGANTINPMSWHELSSFYNTVPSKINYRDKTDAELKKAIEKHRIMVKKAGELITLENMKKSVNEGKTLKEHMAVEDKADIDSLGNFGKRPVSQYTNLWKKAGGKLSGLEANELRSRGARVRTSDVDKSLDTKTKKFMKEHARSKLIKDVKDSATLLRRKKAKDALTSTSNEDKMINTIEKAKDKDIPKLRKQLNDRVKEQLPKEDSRINFVTPSELKRRALKAKRARARVLAGERRKAAMKQQKKLEKVQKKMETRKAREERRIKREKFLDEMKYDGRFDRKLKGVARERQIRLLKKRDILKAKRRRKMGIKEPEVEEKVADVGDETKEDDGPIRKTTQPDMDLGQSTMGNIMKRRGGMESNIPDSLTKEAEAKEFLKKDSAGKKQQIESLTKKAEMEAQAINEKVPDVPGASFKNTVKQAMYDQVQGLGASMLAAYGTDALFKALDPDGKFTKTPVGQLAEGGAIGLATGGVLRGLGSFVSAGDFAELGVGGALGQLAADDVGKSLYPALKKDGMSNVGASGITGAAQGATFAGTSIATGAALRAGASAVSDALSGGATAAAEGTEMTSAAITGATETAEAATAATATTETTELAAIGAAAATGASDGAVGLSELSPIAMVAGVLGGALVGALFGILDAPKEISLLQYAKKGANAKQIRALAKKTGASAQQVEQALNYEQKEVQSKIRQILASKGIYGAGTEIGLSQKESKEIQKQSPFTVNKGLLAEKAGLLPPEQPIPDKPNMIQIQKK